MRSHFDRAVPQNSAECGISHRGNSVHGAGAPLPPSEGFGFRAPPVADTARKASRCRPQVRERIAEARAANGEGAEVRSQYALCRGEPRALPRGVQIQLFRRHLKVCTTLSNVSLRTARFNYLLTQNPVLKQKSRAHLSTGFSLPKHFSQNYPMWIISSLFPPPEELPPLPQSPQSPQSLFPPP